MDPAGSNRMEGVRNAALEAEGGVFELQLDACLPL